MSIQVTKEEYEAELRELNRLRAELSRLRAKYDEKWDRLRRTVANIRYNEARLAELTSRLEALRRIGWARLTGAERAEYLRLRDRLIPEARARIAYWTSQRDAVIAEIYREMPEIRRLEEQVRTEEARIRRKIIVVPPVPLIGVVDSVTGLKILYLKEEFQGYRCWLYDEEKKTYVEHVENIRVEYTASIETDGHEHFIGELTGYTIIAASDLPEIDAIVDELISKTEDWFYRKFAPPPEGEAMFGGPIPREAIEPDFTIQQREHGAKHEDTIQEYYMTAAGEWLSRKIMKKGIGFYANPPETRPKWRRVAVYVEYAHEDEVLGVDHPPITEEIDP
ncbi:MAG: hypothetical protein QXY07_02680 [Candidatus Bathyarchaeia archaeon]